MRRLFAFSAAICVAVVTSLHAQPDARSRPNIVLIITDDVGYGDIGSYGAPDIKTPNIDSLAKAGVRFTQFYANGSSCTPTRAGLISGRYQQRFALERPLERRDAAATAIWACRRRADRCRNCCKTSGYATALIGKWHLGYLPQFSPKAHGFESFFGFKSGYIDYYQHTDGGGQPDLFENDTPVTVDRLHDRSDHRTIGEVHRRARAVAVLPRSRLQRGALAVSGSGSALDGDRATRAHLLAVRREHRTRAQTYVKIMERADRGVGEILAALDRARTVAEHAGDLHQRQRRRVAVAQCAAVQSQVLAL